MDHPAEDTEWNDILRKHGIIPEKPPDRSKELEDALAQAQQIIHDNRLQGKDLDELDELEDEEDADFLDSYRQKRLGELAMLRTSLVYNQVYPVQKPDYAKEVTEESSKAFVFVLLTSSAGTNTESKLMEEIWRELAPRFGDVKFCQMRANLCIEGYPDKNTPTVLVYRDGDIKRQIVTLRELRGDKTNSRDMEHVLVGIGAVKRDDSRLTKDAAEESRPRNGIRDSTTRNTASTGDSDSDWD